MSETQKTQNTQKKSLYLKYRPHNLEDIVGQKHVVATLKKASSNNEFVHAYLFGGERGTGKTSTARIVANLMTCDNVVNGKVCGKCRACTTIPYGASLDVKEMDGATNRGIDDARQLMESAQWSPQELKRKVYILDEVHQLSKEAISSLLKTLEEPPSYLTFILCTTDIKKILPTILSRCQRFNFGKISSSDISQRLSYIAKQESIDIEPEAIAIISKLARGSMRDSIGYLEQIGTVGSGKKILQNHVQSYFGVSDRLGILNIVSAIKSGNIPLVLDQVNDMMVISADSKQIMYEISDIFRSIMVLKVHNNPSKLIDLPDYELQELRKIGEDMDVAQLIKISHLFSNIDKKLEYNINERWIMEATLINCISSLKKE